MKKAIFLYNKKSGRGRAAAPAEEICRIFGEHGYRMEAVAIDFAVNPFDGREEIDLLVAAGGDGTVNFVVNSMKAKGLDVRIGVIPMGTANDFAGALGMAHDPLTAARQIAAGRVERVDCGLANGRYFVNVFSFGIFTTTSQHTPDTRKHRVGKMAYLIEGLRELRSIHGVPLRIEADGDRYTCNALMTLIFNGETAGGFRLARAASVRDGIFECLMLEKRGWFTTAFGMVRYALGGRPRCVRHLRARRCEIVSPIDEPTDVDGQPGPHFPLRVECLRGELRIVCPRGV